MAYTFDGSVVDQELVQLVRPSTAHPTAWEVIAVNAPLVCDLGNETWDAIVAKKVPAQSVKPFAPRRLPLHIINTVKAAPSSTERNPGTFTRPAWLPNEECAERVYV